MELLWHCTFFCMNWIISTLKENLLHFCDNASLLKCACGIVGFSEIIIVYKSSSYVDISLLLHLLFDSLWSIHKYNYLTFIQSHNICSWHHIRWIYTTLILSEYYFLGVYRSNPFVSNLKAVYEISSYVHISSIS